MKKVLFLLTILLLVVTLCGCDNEKNKEDTTNMYIDVAMLTEEEKAIIDLTGGNNTQHIFDFSLDENVKSMYINTYQLVDGEWKSINNRSSRAFSDIKGRLAIDFKNGFEDLKISIQSEHSNGSFSNTSDVENDKYKGMGVSTSLLANKTKIVYEKEIPLAIQIITSKNEVSSYIVEYFEKPEEYEKLDYEYVYAMTVMFSQKELQDLSNNNSNEEKIKDIRKEVYISAIKDLYYNYTLPDGNELEEPKYDENYDMSENQFAICDVDMDGKDELILAFLHHPMAAMRTIIYDFDSNTNILREQFTEFTAINFYNNGIIEVLWSHNQGSAGDSLWPYILYKYNKESDSYDVIAQIDAWNKSFNEKCYIAETFPTEVDKDGNGIVYYIRNSDSDKDIPYDDKEYNEWRVRYIPDDNLKITVPYINLTEENINKINM